MTLLVGEGLMLILVLLWIHLITWRLSAGDMGRQSVADVFSVGYWMDLLDLRHKSAYCRQIAVDLVGVGKWWEWNKYIQRKRMLSAPSCTELAPKCNGFRKKLK